MTYYTLHIDDSGAIEDIDEKNVNGTTIVICKMYDDEEFNKLNDILNATDHYILNEKALTLFKNSKMIPYCVKTAKVLRKEKLVSFLKKYSTYEYFELRFPDDMATTCYDWIDFDKSEIYAIDAKEKQIKISSHQQQLDLIEVNKSDADVKYSFEAKKVVFGKNFDTAIDLFKIPHYSWGVYVSERLKNKLEQAKITDIGFAENNEKLGIVWKPYFPIIEFSM